MSPATINQARRTVAEHARTPSDCQQLLDQLGLIRDDPTPLEPQSDKPKRRCAACGRPYRDRHMRCSTCRKHGRRGPQPA